MKIKLECKDITYDLIEELKKKVDIEPNDIGSWKSLVDLLEIKIGGLEGQIKVLEERQEMLVETNKGLAEEIADLEKENQELKEEINELVKDELCFEKRCDKFEKAIEILKERGGIKLFINRNNNNKLTLDFDDCISCVLEPKEYELLNEVLE